MSYFDHFSISQGTPIGRWIKYRSRAGAYRRIHSYIPDLDAKILEIGPGWGELAMCFRAGGYKYCQLVEPNARMREHLTAMGFVTSDYRVPIIREADQSYDAILLADVFEHLGGMAEAEAFVGEAFRVLRPGGILCILSPDYLHWKIDFFNCDYSHSNITTVRRVVQLLYNCDLRALTYVYYSGFVFGAPATLVSWVMRLAFWYLRGNQLESRWYKLKLTFLRQFLVIAQKSP